MSSTQFATGAPKVLVFDSGVGGLSIVQALRERMPYLSLLYAADTAGFPYGIWSENDLIQRVSEILQRLLLHYQLDLIVIACNTASTIVLPTLRNIFALPVVGVVPAIKPAAQLTRNGVIGLLGTPGTVSRHYTGQLISDFAAYCTVHRVGSVELVHLAEAHLRGETVTAAQLRPMIQPFVQANPPPDVVVLACTHFPLLQAQLTQALPPTVRLIDSGAAIAQRVHTLLLQHGWSIPTTPPSSPQLAIFTQITAAVHQLTPVLQQFGFAAIAEWPQES